MIRTFFRWKILSLTIHRYTGGVEVEEDEVPGSS